MSIDIRKEHNFIIRMDIKNVQTNYTYKRFFVEHWFEEINHRFKLQITLCALILLFLAIGLATQGKLRSFKTTLTIKEGLFYLRKAVFDQRYFLKLKKILVDNFNS